MTTLAQIVRFGVEDDIPHSSEVLAAMNTGLAIGLKKSAPILERYAKTRSFKRKGRRGTINKIKGPYSLRHITGDLRDSIKATSTAKHIILSAGNYIVPYAVVQEVGGRVGSAIGNTAATLPARSFLAPVLIGETDNIRDRITYYVYREVAKV